jgi:hypothetical protein
MFAWIELLSWAYWPALAAVLVGAAAVFRERARLSMWAFRAAVALASAAASRDALRLVEFSIFPRHYGPPEVSTCMQLNVVPHWAYALILETTVIILATSLLPLARAEGGLLRSRLLGIAVALAGGSTSLAVAYLVALQWAPWTVYRAPGPRFNDDWSFIRELWMPSGWRKLAYASSLLLTARWSQILARRRR